MSCLLAYSAVLLYLIGKYEGDTKGTHLCHSIGIVTYVDLFDTCQSDYCWAMGIKNHEAAHIWVCMCPSLWVNMLGSTFVNM